MRNYPVLDGQRDAFKALVADYGTQYADWLTVKPFSGEEADRAAASRLISGKNVAMPVDRISIATGGHHGCMVALLAAGLSGKVVATEDLSYPAFADICRLLGITLIACATDEYGLIPSVLEDACVKHGVRGVYIMPTVHNPTGRVVPLSRREELIAVARKHGLMILDDDAYGFLDETGLPNFAQLAPELGWYVYSVSKPLAPDIKVAYMASPAGTQEAVSEAIKLTTSNPSSFFTSLVSELIRRGDFDELVRQKRAEGRRRQALVRVRLQGVSITAHPNSWHLWVKLPTGRTSGEIAGALSKDGVGVIPGIAFSGNGFVGNDHIRIALGSEPDDLKLLSAVDVVARHFRL